MPKKRVRKTKAVAGGKGGKKQKTPATSRGSTSSNPAQSNFMRAISGNQDSAGLANWKTYAQYIKNNPQTKKNRWK